MQTKDYKERHSRSLPLLGEDGLYRLKSANVAVFGIGGVGGYAAEALCRAGIGSIDIYDHDMVSVSNLNRQIIATESTIGLAKVNAMRDRMLDISSGMQVGAHQIFYSPENADSIDLSKYDYIVDAIDSVPSKLELITRTKELSVPIISAMGAGNKLDPTRLEVADISKTTVCPLAKAVRCELRKRGITSGVKVVFSKEEPCKDTPKENGRPVPASLPFVPSVMGLIMAGEVIRDIALK